MVIVMVDGIASVVHGHHSLFILVVVPPTQHLASVRIQQQVESVKLASTVLLGLLSPNVVKKVLIAALSYLEELLCHHRSRSNGLSIDKI